MRLNFHRLVPIACLMLALAAPVAAFAGGDELPPVSERARQVHDSGMLWDGHNDLPWRLRSEGDMALKKFDLSKRLGSGQTDIPRLREGGVKAQFWSVYIPSEHSNPARTVTEQIDLVHRMVEKYPADLELALTADDVERIVKSGKIASLIGIEGGVAIENSLAQLRAFHVLGARYMTLTHNTTLPWADAANDAPKHDGLTSYGERVVKEMNRLGMLVDISHVSPATMADALRVSKAPVIASHSSAFAICPSPRNVPDDMLKAVKKNGGVVMVNFYSGFIVPEHGQEDAGDLQEYREKYPDPAERTQGPGGLVQGRRGEALPGHDQGRGRPHRPHRQGRGDRPRGHRFRLRRDHRLAGGPRGRFLLSPPDRGTAEARLFRAGRPQDPRRQRAAGVSRGRGRGPEAAGEHAAGGG